MEASLLQAEEPARRQDLTWLDVGTLDIAICQIARALHQAAESGDVGVVKFLLAHGADGDARASDGKTPKDVAHASVAGLLGDAPPAKKAKKC